MKQIVHYIPHKNDSIVLGHRAFITTVVDHPGAFTGYVTNMMFDGNRQVITTDVVNVCEKGFETRNTMYVPVTLDEGVALHASFLDEHFGDEEHE